MFAMEQQVLEGLDLNAINRADLLDDPAFEIHIGGQIFAEKIQRLLPIELQRIDRSQSLRLPLLLPPALEWMLARR